MIDIARIPNKFRAVLHFNRPVSARDIATVKEQMFLACPLVPGSSRTEVEEVRVIKPDFSIQVLASCTGGFTITNADTFIRKIAHNTVCDYAEIAMTAPFYPEGAVVTTNSIPVFKSRWVDHIHDMFIMQDKLYRALQKWHPIDVGVQVADMLYSLWMNELGTSDQKTIPGVIYHAANCIPPAKVLYDIHIKRVAEGCEQLLKEQHMRSPGVEAIKNVLSQIVGVTDVD